ncbi:MAG TPA: polysaccharide deacetylase family protein [Candidatus Paceibacterota bacterium]|nr:polysaccharide deacetylase family protein [Candidatus Paceibacterota bacterium]
MHNIIVTTSWDDGHVLDQKLASLLRRYALSGTFYISPEDKELSPNERLTPEQVAKLSEDFEIGAHTMTHPRLSQVSDEVAKKEIVESKRVLERWIGKSVTSFCYPGGEYRPKHIAMVREAGFTLARTVKRFATDLSKDPLILPTTVHAYRHWSDIFPILKFARYSPAQFISYYFNWDALAMAQFDRVCQTGGVFHLWGHSWEIEHDGDWERLENVLRHIAKKDHIMYRTNGQLYDI